MNVAVIGLGDMGMPIARNLAKENHVVTAYDRDAARLHTAGEHGIRAATSAAEAVGDAEIVHVVVFTDDQVREITLGPASVLAACAPDTIVVLHSTVRPSTCVEVAEAAKAYSVHVVDAGMTGTLALAESGELTLLVGGDVDAVERCRPEFAAFASNVIHLGPPGTGLAGKILNNLLVLANAESLRQMVELAIRAGVDESRFLELISVSTARSWVSDNWSRISSTVLGGGDPHYTAMSLKDSALASDLAAASNLVVPVVDLVAARLQSLNSRVQVEQ